MYIVNALFLFYSFPATKFERFKHANTSASYEEIYEYYVIKDSTILPVNNFAALERWAKKAAISGSF